MVDNVNKMHSVKKGECAWKIAKETLKATGKTVTNKDILKEMERLAKLNDCNSVEDFNKKFFKSVGKNLITEKTKPVNTQQTNNKKIQQSHPKAIVADNDSTYVEKKAFHKTLKNKQIKNLDKHLKSKPTTIINKPTVKQDSIKATPSDTTKIAKKTASVTKDFQQRINAMKNDEERVVEYNKKNYKGQYYGIVDKKSCQLKIYNKSGKVVKVYPVGVGKTKGDGLGSYFMDEENHTKDAYKAETQRLTTAGECTIDEQKTAAKDYISKKDHKVKVMSLKGDNRGYRGGQLSIHMIPNSLKGERVKKFKTKTPIDNRMSYGCINLMENDYDSLKKMIGEGDKIYILPEEAGNKLQLKKQRNGSYKFEQAFHKNVKRDCSNEQASIVNYDVKPEKNPNYIANKKATQEHLIAKKNETQNEFRWYNPIS